MSECPGGNPFDPPPPGGGVFGKIGVCSSSSPGSGTLCPSGTVPGNCFFNPQIATCDSSYCYQNCYNIGDQSSLSQEDILECCLQTSPNQQVCGSYYPTTLSCTGYMNALFTDGVSSTSPTTVEDTLTTANTYLSKLTCTNPLDAGAIASNMMNAYLQNIALQQDPSGETTAGWDSTWITEGQYGILNQLATFCQYGRDTYACQSNMETFCTGATRSGLTTPNSNDKSGTRARMCGCYMDADITNYPYMYLPGVGVACDSMCGSQYTIKNAGVGYCDNTVCIIDDVSINIANSVNPGGITIANVCGSDCGSEQNEKCNSECYIGNITIDENKSIVGKLNLAQNCQTCVDQQGNPIQCPGNGAPSRQGSGWGQKIERDYDNMKEDWDGWFSKNRRLGLVIIITLLVFFILSIFYLMRPSAEHKRKEEKRER